MKKVLMTLCALMFAATTIFAQDLLTLIEIQGEQATSPYENEVVTFNAKVTEYYGNTWFMQDAFGAWNGIYVKDSTLLVPENPPWWNEPRQPEVGDELTLTGTVVEVNGNTQLENVTLVEQTEFWLATPSGTEVTAADSQVEDLEGTRVRLMNMTVTSSTNANLEWVAMDLTGEVHCVGVTEFLTPETDDIYNVYGALCEVNGVYWVHVGSLEAVYLAVDENDVIEINAFPNPAKDQIRITTDHLINRWEMVSVSGQIVRSSVEMSNSFNIDRGDLASGNYVIQLYTESKMTRQIVSFH